MYYYRLFSGLGYNSEYDICYLCFSDSLSRAPVQTGETKDLNTGDCSHIKMPPAKQQRHAA